jgi:hypothetical protein
MGLNLGSIVTPVFDCDVVLLPPVFVLLKLLLDLLEPVPNWRSDPGIGGIANGFADPGAA